jgi:hypothetical protein
VGIVKLFLDANIVDIFGFRFDIPYINSDLRLLSDELVHKLFFMYFILGNVCSHKYVVPKIERCRDAKALTLIKSSLGKNWSELKSPS